MPHNLATDPTGYFQIARAFFDVVEDGSEISCEGARQLLDAIADLDGRSWSCTDLHHSLFLRADEVRTCCKRFFVDGERRGDVVLYDFAGQGPLELEDIVLAKRALHRDLNSGRPSACDGCDFMSFEKWGSIDPLDIRYLSIENHSVCSMKCTYCGPEYFGGLKEKYDTRATIDSLLEVGALDNCDTVVWGGGEPVIGRAFDTMLNTIAEKTNQAEQRVLTNSVRTSKAVKELIAQGRVAVTTSIDAGSPQTFKSIRGLDAMERVLCNLRSYAEVDPSRVTVK